MRLIDANAYLGHWAARRLRHNTPAGLLKLMDRAGIESALVSSASAIMYRNCQAGNEELHEMLAGAGERLLPLAVMNPAYAGWRRDLQWCRQVMGTRAIRLYPTYHHYQLSDACCSELVDVAAAMDLPITIPVRVEDYRERHWLIDAPDVRLNDLAALAAAHPRARFIFVNGLGYLGSDLVQKAADLPANYWLDIARPDVVYGNEVSALTEALGPGRLVFGSGIPFNYPEPATLKMAIMKASAEDKEKIGSANLLSLLGI